MQTPLIIRFKQCQYSYIDYNRTENDNSECRILSEVRLGGTAVILRSHRQTNFLNKYCGIHYTTKAQKCLNVQY